VLKNKPLATGDSQSYSNVGSNCIDLNCFFVNEVQACFTVDADAGKNHDMRRDILPVINRAKILTIFNFIHKINKTYLQNRLT